ncbi:hypothetical protein K1719_000459 [Acacia pycnantha]|nr:hypothetical protein K1719_000459 [Acacia pycnantha]
MKTKHRSSLYQSKKDKNIKIQIEKLPDWRQRVMDYEIFEPRKTYLSLTIFLLRLLNDFAIQQRSLFQSSTLFSLKLQVEMAAVL